MKAAKASADCRAESVFSNTASSSNTAITEEPTLPPSTFQQRMQLIQHNKNYFPVATESVDKENVIINKKTLESLDSSSYCEECSTTGEITFTHVDSDVFVTVKCSGCESILFSNVDMVNNNQKFFFNDSCKLEYITL